MVAPSVLPGRAFKRVDRVSRLLFHYRAADLGIKPLTGQTPAFSRASRGSMVDSFGVGSSAVHSQPRFDMLDLESAGFRKNAGLVFEGARTQLVTDPENFGAWTAVNVTRTAGQADPFGGTAAYKLEATAGADNRIQQAVVFTGNATKALLGFVRGDTSTESHILVLDTTAAVVRHNIQITWTAGVPTLSTDAGSGTLFSVVPWEGGWYAIMASADSIVAANTHLLQIYPADLAGTGSIFFFGANAWNAAFPSTYQGPSLGSRSAELMTVPIGFDPMELTVSWKIARPVLLEGATGIAGIFDIGDSSVNHLWAYLDRAAGTYFGSVDSGTTVSSNPAFGAGAVLEGALHLELLLTGARVRMDLGSGYGAFSGATSTPLSAWANARIQVGGIANGVNSLWSALAELKVAAGNYPLAQMRQLI
jgi:hypothetical protein